MSSNKQLQAHFSVSISVSVSVRQYAGWDWESRTVRRTRLVSDTVVTYEILHPGSLICFANTRSIINAVNAQNFMLKLTYRQLQGVQCFAGVGRGQHIFQAFWTYFVILERFNLHFQPTEHRPGWVADFELIIAPIWDRLVPIDTTIFIHAAIAVVFAFHAHAHISGFAWESFVLCSVVDKKEGADEVVSAADGYS